MYQSQALPVNPMQVDSTYFIYNAPQQPAPFPAVPVPPALQQMAGYILGLATAMIQSNAAANPARTFFANMVSRNNWNNPEAQMVASIVFDVVQRALASSPPNTPPQVIMEQAVWSAVSMAVAVIVSQYQEGVTQYLNPQLIQQLNQALQQYQQFRQGGMNPMPMQSGWGGGWSGQPQMMGGYNPAMQMAPGPYGFNSMQQMGPRPGFGGYPPMTNTQPLANQGFVSSRFGGVNQPPAAGGFFNAAPPMQSNSGSISEMNYQTKSPDKSQEEPMKIKNSFNVRNLDIAENQKYVFQSLDDINELEEPAQEESKEQNIVAFNPLTHQMADGVLLEIPMESYEEHELNPVLREQAAMRRAARQGKSLIDWSKLVSVDESSASTSQEAEKSNDITSEEDTVVVREDNIDVVALANSDDPIKDVAEALDDLIDGKDAVVVKHLYTTEIKTRQGEKLLKLLEEIRESESLSEIVQLLRQIDEQFALSDAGNIIDGRLTKHLNEMMKYNLGLDWSIDSFKDDIIELQKLVRQKAGAKIHEIFMDMLSVVISRSIETIPDMAELSNDTAVLLLNATSDQLSIKVDKTSVVEARFLPNLHELLSFLFNKTPDFPDTFQARYLMTKDKKVFRVDEALLNEGAYFITPL